MKLRKIMAAVLICFAGLANAQMQMPTIPLDPDVRIGKLDNGLTYYIRHNNWPEKRANFYIAQKVARYRKRKASADSHTSWSTCASTAQRTSRATR